jgi:signal transduction histidine kinase
MRNPGLGRRSRAPPPIFSHVGPVPCAPTWAGVSCTRPAEEPATPPPSTFDEIQREELSRLYALMVKARLSALPVFVAVLAWLAVGDPAPWRRVLLAVGVPLVASFFLGEALRYRSRGLGRRTVRVSLSVAVVAQLVLSAASGGAESPFLPMALPLAIACGLFLPRRLAYALSFLQVAAVLGLTALAAYRLVPGLHPAVLGGGPSGGHSAAHLWASALLLGALVVVTQGAGRVLRRALDATLRRALAAQEEALRARTERAEELGALSAEIAHELRGPVATVARLGALLGPADGAGGERLALLRREADRMQTLLDGLLNFSRPLVPIALGRVDLAALAREVAAQHEAPARERGVAVETRGDAVAARCDPRKVRQALVNLVQDALEASPPGAPIEIEVAQADAGARVRVLDRRPTGGGEAPAPAAPGVGLAVARALALQHGGDLVRAARPGGGCAAELTLPAGDRGR